MSPRTLLVPKYSPKQDAIGAQYRCMKVVSSDSLKFCLDLLSASPLYLGLTDLSPFVLLFDIVAAV